VFIPIGDAPNDTSRMPWVNYGLVALNVLVFAWAFFGHRGDLAYTQWIQQWGYVPLVPRLDSLFTHMFMHAGVFHLAGNMLFLWVFGDNVERRLGHVGYLFFYLACGLAAVLVFHTLAPLSTVPLVGASGAIFGVEGFYFLAFPKNRVRVLIWVLLIFTFWIPARVMLGVSFLLNLVSPITAYGSTGGGGVAYAAHVGGFLAGLGMAAALKGAASRSGGEDVAREVPLGRAGQALVEAQRLVEAGRFPEADAQLEQILSRHLHDRAAPEAALVLGMLRSRVLGRPEGALSPLRFASRLHPEAEGRAAALEELARITAAR